MIRVVRAMASVMFLLSACGQQQAQVFDPVNQFRTASESLTLPDGGTCAITIAPDSELMIRALAVVEDPVRTRWTGSTTNLSDGAWSFGRLMTAMAGANDPQLFVQNWLAQWDTPRPVNGFTVPPRPMAQQVTNAWLAASGGARLDLTRAPFRLLAIVNRMDLRNLAAGSAGEGRFVFGVLDPAGNPLQFTVIFEYSLPAKTDAEVRAWADAWHGLAAQPVGSAAFNQALEAITNKFAGPNAAPGRPNGSAINQVRSNEIALAAPWELREFHLNAAGQLAQAPTAQTTDLTINNSATLANFINSNTPALLAGTHVVTPSLLAGSALTNPGHFWTAPGITNPEARFRFSINTCNGCHAGETGTRFLHVSPRAAGTVAALSTFLTGETQLDPVTLQSRTFNDLQTRASSLGEVLCAAVAAPTVTVTAPTQGSTVRGVTTLTATAGAGVTSVQFLLDGQPVTGSLPSPFSTAWDTGSRPFGTHSIVAVGQTATGTVSSAAITFTTAPTSAPDFSITRVVVPTTAVRLGATFSVTVDVCNLGNQLGSAPIDLFLAADSTSVPPSPNLRGVGGTFVTLNAAECRTVPVQVTANPPPPLTPPPGQPLSQAFFLTAIADSANGIAELSETNNRSPAVTLAIGDGPDFVVSSLSGAVSAQTGNTFTAQAVVCNRGTQSGSADLELVISTDAVINPPFDGTPPTPTSDVRVGLVPVPTLAAGQCISQPITGRATPPGAPTGSFFLGAVINWSQRTIELNPKNNASSALRFDVGNGPDFRVGSLFVPTSAVPGATFTATANVCNVGTAPGFTDVRLLLSTDAVLTSSPTPLPTDDLIIGTASLNLNPGACQAIPMTAVAQAPNGDGSYFVGLIVDPANLVPELNETNNKSAAPSMLIGNGPDFSITSISSPVSVLPGATFSAVVSVCNLGTQSGTTRLDVVLSADSIISLAPGSLDVPVGGTSVTLAAGQCQGVTVPSTAVQVSAGNSAVIGAIVDAQGAVRELLETNNTRVGSTVFIGSLPEFVISAVSVPSSALPGAPFTATATVCNRGTVPGTTSVDLVLSTDSLLTPTAAPGPGADRTMGTVTITLAPGACAAQALSGTADASPGGPLFVGAVVDLNGAVAEFSETNNVSAATQMLVGTAPDFVVTSVTVVPQVVGGVSTTVLSVGQAFQASVTACNRGTVPGTAPVDLFMSADTVITTNGPGSDLRLGQGVFTLAAGQCLTQLISTTAVSPTGLGGTFFMAGVADVSAGLTELSKTNNVSPLRSVVLQ